MLLANTFIGTGNPNMCQDAATSVAINGSVTPVIFSIKPLPGQSGDITRLTMVTTSSNNSDLTTFGGSSALVVGLTLRKKRADGTFKNIYTYRQNFDMVIHGFDSGIFEPKGGNSIHGFASRVTFAGQDKHGVTVRLDGSYHCIVSCLTITLHTVVDSSLLTVTKVTSATRSRLTTHHVCHREHLRQA